MSRTLAFVVVLWPAVAFAQQSASPTPSSAAASLIPWLLQEKEELTQLPFGDVIFSATGKKVIAIDPKNETDQRVLKQPSWRSMKS